MLARPLALALPLALLAGCGASPAPLATPEVAPSEATPAPSAASADPVVGETASEPSAPVAKKVEATVPDDYELTPRDCRELALQFGALIRSDEVAKLSPKLSDKQREQAVASIEKAASVRRDQWSASCESSLVGKVQERKTLKCAVEAKSVAAFDVCLNGEQAGKVADEPAAKPAGKKKR